MSCKQFFLFLFCIPNWNRPVIVIGAIIIGAVTVDVFRSRADAKAKRPAVAQANAEAK